MIEGRPMSVPMPPEELARALAATPNASAAFEALPPSHQREYATWIDGAKRRETRERRAAQAVARLIGVTR